MEKPDKKDDIKSCHKATKYTIDNMITVLRLELSDFKSTNHTKTPPETPPSYAGIITASQK